MYVELKGPFTIGDLRRALEKFGDNEGLLFDDIDDDGIVVIEKDDIGKVVVTLRNDDDEYYDGEDYDEEEAQYRQMDIPRDLDIFD